MEAFYTMSCSLMIKPDGPLITSYMIRHKTLPVPPSSTTKPMLEPKDTTSSIFGAIMAEEDLTIDSSKS
jgi:hypothetical protein